MNNKLIRVGLVVALAAGCGGRSAKSGDQQQFETVQEGSAAGVTTTIRGPGETLPPITGTNADTTTAFALDPNAIATNTATGTEMGAYSTSPNEGSAGASSGAPALSPSSSMQPSSNQPASRPSPTATTARTRRVEPAPPTPSAQPEPADEPETDTSTTTVAPPTNTAPPPTTASPEPPQTDTEAEQPPPTTTTTNGEGDESSDGSQETPTPLASHDSAA